MKHKRRGVALVLNHVNFESMSTRKGSIKDSLDLKASLGKLGFDVRIYTDPTVKTITTILQTSKYNTRNSIGYNYRAEAARIVCFSGKSNEMENEPCASHTAEIMNAKSIRSNLIKKIPETKRRYHYFHPFAILQTDATVSLALCTLFSYLLARFRLSSYKM